MSESKDCTGNNGCQVQCLRCTQEIRGAKFKYLNLKFTGNKGCQVHIFKVYTGNEGCQVYI